MNHENIVHKEAGQVIYKDNNYYRGHFESVDDYMQFVSTKTDDAYKNERIADYMYMDDDDWLGGMSGREMQKHIGERTLCKSMQKRLQDGYKVLPINTTVEPTQENGVFLDQTGITCDMGAYYAGEDNCMINYDLHTEQRPTVWIAQNIICRAGADTQNFINRGFALVNAIKTLQAQNINVGVVAYIHGKNDKDILVSIVVKKPEEALNVPLVTNTLAHPCFFRALGHAATCKISVQNEGGMSARNYTKPEEFKLSFADADNMLVLTSDFGLEGYESEEQALDNITEQCNTHFQKLVADKAA